MRIRHRFHSTQDICDPDIQSEKGGYSWQEPELESEVDFTLMYKIDRVTTYWVGYSRFFAGDFIPKTGSHNDIYFFYTMIKYTF